MTLAFAPLTVIPDTLSYELLLTTTAPLSHHDPATQDDSNRTLFNRQKQILVGPVGAALPTQAELDALAAAHPVPADLAPLVADLSPAEFVACALIRLFLDVYNRGDGAGLFRGVERYARLESRLHLAAVGARTLRQWWDRLCGGVQVPIHDADADRPLLALLGVPAGLGQLALRSLTDDYRSLVALGRAWHQATKLQSESYAAKAGQAVARGESVALHFVADAIAPRSEQATVLEVPTVSGNSLRHQCVRAPAWHHLAAALALAPGEPGQGPLAPGAEAVFVNGGNIRAGAKQPSNPFALAQRVRATYPTLDLLGGVTDSFDLGESRLQVGAWLVCRENAAALADSPAASRPTAGLSAFDLLDDVTLTRQAGQVGTGQMIYSFETLCAGTEVLVRLTLTPWTPARTRGACVAAVETWLAAAPTAGGQAARGFGHLRGAWLRRPDDGAARAEYEAYLAAEADRLRAGLVDGTLGCGQVVVS